MVTPGSFEYFVEVALPDGHTAPVVANASAPRRVEVLPPPQPPTRPSARASRSPRSRAPTPTRACGSSSRWGASSGATSPSPRGGYGSRREDAAGFTVGGNVQLAF